MCIYHCHVYVYIYNIKLKIIQTLESAYTHMKSVLYTQTANMKSEYTDIRLKSAYADMMSAYTDVMSAYTDIH